MLPRYFYTDSTKESVEWFNNTYDSDWCFPWAWKYIWFDWNYNTWTWTDKWDTKEEFKNNHTYLTPKQFMKAIKEEQEFKRWDIVIDEDGDEVEFVVDLLEEDTEWYRYIINDDWRYFFSNTVTKKKELTEIEKAIELLTREWKIKDGKILI